MGKTMQLGIRIDKELIERIEILAKHEGIDKMDWIRRALAVFASDEEAGMSDEAIEDYIHLRIDEKKLLDFALFKQIPNDIKKAREEYLKNITKDEK